MPQSAVQNFYRYHALVYDSTRWMILHGRRGAVARLGLRPDSSVLEIGCGTGLNFGLLQKHLHAERGRLVGLDFSADMLRIAERRVASAGWRNVELLQADATTMTLDRQFDAILFAYSLTMIPDWEAALHQARRHLAPRGRCVVLDFGDFHGWGVLAPVMRAWLRANHVETLKPYTPVMQRVFGNAEVKFWLGGYNFTALAQG